jgi:carbonic anhydrase
MSLHEQIDREIQEKRNWALRRQLGIPNNKRLWVLADGVTN